MEADGHRLDHPHPLRTDGAAPERTSARGTLGQGHFRRQAEPGRARDGTREIVAPSGMVGVLWGTGDHPAVGSCGWQWGRGGITPRWGGSLWCGGTAGISPQRGVRQNCWFPSAEAGVLGVPAPRGRAASHLQTFSPEIITLVSLDQDLITFDRQT